MKISLITTSGVSSCRGGSTREISPWGHSKFALSVSPLLLDANTVQFLCERERIGSDFQGGIAHEEKKNREIEKSRVNVKLIE